MEDRPLSSYDAVSVTPDHRSNGDCNRSSSASLIESKLQNHQNAADLSSTNCNTPSLPPQQQQQFPMSSNNSKNTNGGDKISDNNTLQCNSASGDLISEGAPGCSSIDDWKQKLDMFLQDKGKQEMVSREKKDRRNFEQLAALASEMGLYSHHYPKIVVFSKVPLPNYRFDLDDKRPQREVNIHSGLQKRVDSCLSKYISWKSRTKERLSDICISRSSGIWSTVSDECHFEQSELQAPGKVVAKKILQERSLHLRDQQQTWQESPDGRRMLGFRQSLPAYKEKDVILTAISKNQVILVSGETGCGKTTQIPQFILESEIDSFRGASCNIICTQPRRISAISVSERVASERGEKLGESVGYKVRLEGMKGKDTHLLFCTTGILLRRLLADRNLKGVTHVIVDEIHERGVDEDFLLIVLKDLLPCCPELRLILMSATLDTEFFSSYFGGAPVIHISGFAYPVKAHFLENILEKTGYRLTSFNQIDDYGQERMWKTNKKQQAPRKKKSQIASLVEDVLKAAEFKDFSPQTLESLLSWNPDCIGFNLIEYLLSYICENERPGAVLVFMIGWDDICALKDKLEAHPVLGDPNRVLLLACHGSMASSEQRLIFEKPEDGVRKIVLSTNIAETSITVNDVVFVLDCGKAKEASYDALNNTPCLLPSWISKASAQQRRGRAGRVQPGECYHLYPRCLYDAFSGYQLPEILRTPLHSLCLKIKSLKLGSISEFLSRALQSPELLAVQNAIEYLQLIGALDENENLTVLGRYLTMLPMEPKLGKMLILGVILNCLDPILTVAAGLSLRDPFLNPLDKKDRAEAAKSKFSGDYSDHLALIRAYEGWREAERDLTGNEYCWKNFLSAQSMKAIDSLREELLSLLNDTGLIDGSTANCRSAWSYDVHLIRGIICYGLYPGVCSVVHNEKSFKLKTMEDGQVHLYSNSVNARESKIPYPWLVFNEKIKVNTVFLRDSTAVSDSVLLLFGGSISKGDVVGHLKMLGGYLEFFMKPDVADMFQNLRREFDELIEKKLLNPRLVMSIHHDLLSAVRILVSEDQSKGSFVYGRQVLKPTDIPITKTHPTMVSRISSGPGGDNSKGQLQTLLARRGHTAPVYTTTQLNNQFKATVEFNGMQITGRPCTNKKSAEKDAAAEALQWLMRETEADRECINHMPTMLKKSKKHH